MHPSYDTAQCLAILRRHVPVIRRRYGIRSLGIFGSYVRRQQSSNSDLDILVTFAEPPSLLRFIELENRLSDLLGIKVDLVMKDVLKPVLARRVLREQVPV